LAVGKIIQLLYYTGKNRRCGKGINTKLIWENFGQVEFLQKRKKITRIKKTTLMNPCGIFLGYACKVPAYAG